MILRFLSWLIALANSDAGFYKRDFYQIKDRLLKRYGRRVGTDVQHIRDECWGYESVGHCEGKYCRKCYGTGVWSERWIELERWEIGGRIFHRPSGQTGTRFAMLTTIEGRIRHRDVSGSTAKEALLWLALLYDRRLFWRTLKGGRYLNWHWSPMLMLNTVVSISVQYLNRWKPRKCSCGRYFIRPFAKSYWLICQRCEHRPRFVFAGTGEEDDDLPF